MAIRSTWTFLPSCFSSHLHFALPLCFGSGRRGYGSAISQRSMLAFYGVELKLTRVAVRFLAFKGLCLLGGCFSRRCSECSECSEFLRLLPGLLRRQSARTGDVLLGACMLGDDAMVELPCCYFTLQFLSNIMMASSRSSSGGLLVKSSSIGLHGCEANHVRSVTLLHFYVHSLPNSSRWL